MGKVICIAAALMAIASVSAAQPAAPVEAQQLANRVVALLAKHDSRSVARLMHYPPAYTEEQRSEDMAGVETSISFLLGRFGIPSAVQHEQGPVAFFEVGWGGGDLPYWYSLSPIETFDFIYSAEFSKLGVGIIKVRVFRHPAVSKPEIQLVGFGLPVTRADAKSEIVSAAKALIQLDGSVPAPNIDEILEQSIAPQEHLGVTAEQISQLFRAGRYVEVVELTQGVEEFGSRNETLLNVLILRAISLRRLGRTSEAVRTFEHATRIVGAIDNIGAAQYAEVFYELAELYGEEGDFKRALAVVNTGLRLRPRSATHQILAAFWHEKLGHTDRARAGYREALPILAPDTEGRVVVEARLSALGDTTEHLRVEPKSQTVHLAPSIVIVPINGIDKRVDLVDVCLLLEATLRLRCIVNPMLRIREEKLMVGGRLQYDAGTILALLREARPPDREKDFVLAVTDRDMYMGNANFVFSMQDTTRRLAVVSSYRLLERLPAYWDPDVLATRRMLIQALSAVGLGFGLERPSSPQCPLAYPNSVEEFVTKSAHLCETTQAQWRQILKAVGSRPARFDQQRLATLIRLQQRYLIDSGAVFEFHRN